MVFADGTFVDGSTLELSADGPLREPYIVYSQVTHMGHLCCSRSGYVLANTHLAGLLMCRVLAGVHALDPLGADIRGGAY